MLFKNRLKKRYRNFTFPKNIKLIINPSIEKALEILSARKARHTGMNLTSLINNSIFNRYLNLSILSASFNKKLIKFSRLSKKSKAHSLAYQTFIGKLSSNKIISKKEVKELI